MLELGVVRNFLRPFSPVRHTVKSLPLVKLQVGGAGGGDREGEEGDMGEGEGHVCMEVRMSYANTEPIQSPRIHTCIAKLY